MTDASTRTGGTATGLTGPRRCATCVRASAPSTAALNWGAAFFGWLVAVGMAVILLGLLSAAGAAFGLSDVSEAEAQVER